MKGYAMSTVDIPERLNAASLFIDRHIGEGRAAKSAIFCGDSVVTYRDLYENVNRFGNVLLNLGVRVEERIAI
jgi:acyl-coenzyme A synthetase/AMP-(fatty) acid ligase